MIRKIAAIIMAAACMMCFAVTSQAADTLLTLDYTDSKELITSSDDLFSNIGTLMPGDVVSDTLSIENKNDNTVELFFKSIPLSESDYYLSEDYDLLNKIELNIDFNGKTIYDGTLIGTELNDIISLGKFKSGESGDFKFTLTVPGELTNEFNMTETKVKWYFAVTEDAIPVTPTPQDSQDSIPTVTISKNDSLATVDTTSSPHTGAAVGTGIGGLLAASAIIYICKKREDTSMKIKKKIVSTVLSGITALSATLSCLPIMTTNAILSRDNLGWNQGTYNYMTAITKGITSLSTTAGINTAGNGNNQTGLKNCLGEIQNAGYTFNFSGRVKSSNQYIIVYDGSGNEKARCALSDNIYNLNSTIASLSGENYAHIIDYKNNNNYYGTDEPARNVTAISMDGSDNNVVYKNKTGFSIYDSRNYIGIAHNATGKDYFIKLPDPSKCKIAMLYKNGGSYINTTNGQTQDVDVLVTCNNFDYADEEVPYMSTGTTVEDEDNEWAYLTADMVRLLKEKGLTTSTISRRSDSLIYKKLPEVITKKHIVTHGDGITTTTTYKYEYVIPTYLISDATKQGVFYAIENYLKTTKQGTEQPTVNRNYYYPRRTQFTKRYITNVTNACLRFTDNRPGIYGGVANWFDMNYKFYKAGTNTPVAVSGYSCWKDVDGQQGVSSSAFVDKITTNGGREIWATGTWEKAADTSIKRYNWQTQSGTSLTGYFDYKVTNSSPSDTSNWIFATFSNKASMNLIYSFWGAFSDTQKNRLGMLPSGWMMCDYPGPDRDFYATYRVQKVIDDGSGKLYRLENSEYGVNADHIIYNIGFVLTDEDGNVCQLTKGQNSDGETIDRGNYAYSKTLNTKDLTKGTLLRASNSGYVYFSNLPLGKYRLVEAVTTKSFNGNQPIPASKMIFSDAEAEGNHCNDTFDGATISVKNGQVSISCQGATINPVTTTINVSHIINFESDKQDYAANGGYTGIIADGVDGKQTPVNSRIINNTSEINCLLTIQKTITQANGSKSNATYSNAEQLLKNIKFAIKNEDNYYAIITNGNLTGWSKSQQLFSLNSNGQANISGLGFGSYTLIEQPLENNNNVSDIWNTDGSVDFTLDTTCNYEGGNYNYSINIDNPELYGGFTVKKTTATNTDISGIKFYLSGTSDSGRKIIMPVVTDNNGYGKFDRVPVGTYTLSEDPDTVPEGWTVAADKTIVIKKGQTAEVNITEVENTPKKPKTGTIRIKKINSENGEILSGAEFTIYNDINANKKYDSDDTFVDKILIGGSGVGAKSDLLIGDYLVKETKAPDGYIIDNNYYFISVEEEKISEIKTNTNGFANTPIKGSIKITKVDKENTSTKLTGAVFNVFKDVDGNGQYQSAVDTLVGTMIENNGVHTMDNLPYGKYIVRESKAPSGYLLDANNYTVNITENSKTYVVSNITGTDLFGNTPIKGNIKLTKVDKENTANKLSNAGFTVYNETGAAVGNMNVSNGVYTMSNLRYGKYTVKETKAPTGYVEDTNVYTVNITENGKTYVVSNIAGTELFANTPIKGNIKLTKVDKENTAKKLSNAEFTVYNETGAAVGNMSVSNGVYTMSNLKYGKYTVKETKVPTGYVADTNAYTVNITENGRTYVVSNIAGTDLFGNTPIKSNIKLTKVDFTNTKTKLSGAIFNVFKDVDGNGQYQSAVDTLAGKMTESNGVYSLNNLPYGKYIVRESKAPSGYKLDVSSYAVNVTENDKTYVVSNISGTGLFGNEPYPSKIILTKRIPVNEINGHIWFEHGNPTFIFKLVNTTSGKEYNHTYYKTVEFTKDYVKDHTTTIDGVKYVEMSVTFDNLKAGTYTASEQITGQRYKLKSIMNVSNGAANGSKCNFTLSPGQTGKATFYNIKQSYDTNTHNSLCVNVIKK